MTKHRYPELYSEVTEALRRHNARFYTDVYKSFKHALNDAELDYAEAFIRLAIALESPRKQAKTPRTVDGAQKPLVPTEASRHESGMEVGSGKGRHGATRGARGHAPRPQPTDAILRNVDRAVILLQVEDRMQGGEATNLRGLTNP